jgi:hypothetical protein
MRLSKTKSALKAFKVVAKARMAKKAYQYFSKWRNKPMNETLAASNTAMTKYF